MGLYPIACIICTKVFLWHSFNAFDQRCSECKEKDNDSKKDTEKEQIGKE